MATTQTITSSPMVPQTVDDDIIDWFPVGLRFIRRTGRPSNLEAVLGPGTYYPALPSELLSYFKVTPVYEKEVSRIDRRTGKAELHTMKIVNKFPTFERFFSVRGILLEDAIKWRKDGKHKTFAKVYGICEALQRDWLVTTTMEGHYNPVFAKFVGNSMLGMQESVTSILSNPDGSSIQQPVADALSRTIDRLTAYNPIAIAPGKVEEAEIIEP